jgi:hypothetical protein
MTPFGRKTAAAWRVEVHLSLTDLLFMAAGLLGHTVLLFVLFWRKRASNYPIFTALIVMEVIRTLVLASVVAFGSKRQYYFSYWSLALIDAALQFSVVYELAAHTFRPLGTWARDVRGSLIGLTGLSLAVAAGLTWLASPPTRLWMQTVVIKSTFFSSVCMSELLVSMLALSVTVGLPWKTHAAKISLGLGSYSMMDVLIEGGHNYFGILRDNHVYQALVHIRMDAYLCCVCYWVLALWPDEPPSRQLTEEMRSQLLGLHQRVQEILERLQSGSNPE